MTKINVLGVGGEGLKIAGKLATKNLPGIDIYGIDSCKEQLYSYIWKEEKRCYIGEDITGGLGSGSNLELARDAAFCYASEIKKCLKGADLVLIVAGIGGGIGTAVSKIIAGWSKEEFSAITVGIMSKPMQCEGSIRNERAKRYDNIPFDLLFTFDLEDYFQKYRGEPNPVAAAFDRSNEEICTEIEYFLRKVQQIPKENLDEITLVEILMDANKELL